MPIILITMREQNGGGVKRLKRFREIIQMKSILLLMTLIVGYSLSAQTISDTIKTDTTAFPRMGKFPVLSLGYTSYSPSSFEYGNTEADIAMSEFNGVLQYSIKLKDKKTYLLNRFHFNLFQITQDNILRTSIISSNYYSFTVGLGIIQVLKNRWKIIGTLNPTYASDGHNPLSMDDMILQASLLASKRKTPNFEYGFGLVSTTRFGNRLVTPVVSWTYSKNEWISTALLPVNATVAYQLKKVDLGIRYTAFGNVYNSKYSDNTDLELDKLGYSRLNIGPDILINIYKSFYLNINSGITIRNRLQSFTSGGKQELDLATQNKLFFNVSLKVLK